MKPCCKPESIVGGKGGGGFGGGTGGGGSDDGLAGLGMLLGMLGGGGGLGALLQGSGKGKGKGGWQKTFKVDKSGGELGEFTGTIKSFSMKWNYGFIECPELAEYGDVFLHGNMKMGYRQGQKVKFTCVVNKDGKPNAIDLKSGLKDSQGKEHGRQDEGGGELGQFSGTIENRGWKYGFIQCGALEKKGYEKVFILGHELKEYQAGQKIKFTAYLDSQGRCQAKDVKSGLK